MLNDIKEMMRSHVIYIKVGFMGIFKIFIIFFKMFFNDSNRLNQDIKLKLLGPLFKNHNFFLEV